MFLRATNVFARFTDVDSSSDDTAFLQTLLDGAKPGTTIFLPRPRFRISRALRINVPSIHLDGQGAEIIQSSGTAGGLAISASGVTVSKVTLTASGNSTGAGVGCMGTPDTRLTDVQVDGVTLSGWSYGVLARLCESAAVLDNTISDISYAGVMFLSSRNCTVGRNTIRRVTGRPNAYGIAVSRETGSLGEHPLSSGCVIFGNHISDVTHWEGIDTHGGQDIEIRDNDISNVRIGIMMTYSEGFAPQRCHAHHNIVKAGTAEPQTGAEIVGLPIQQAEDCAIEFNTIDGFGTTGGVDGGSVRVQYASRPRVVSNRITNSRQSALVLFGKVDDAEVTDNTILGIDARVGAYIAAIKVPDGIVTGRITDNHIEAGMAAGIRVHSRQRIVVGGNYIATTGRPYHPDLSYFLPRQTKLP